MKQPGKFTANNLIEVKSDVIHYQCDVLRLQEYHTLHGMLPLLENVVLQLCFTCEHSKPKYLYLNE